MAHCVAFWEMSDPAFEEPTLSKSQRYILLLQLRSLKQKSSAAPLERPFITATQTLIYFMIQTGRITHHLVKTVIKRNRVRKTHDSRLVVSQRNGEALTAPHISHDGCEDISPNLDDLTVGGNISEQCVINNVIIIFLVL